MKQIRKMYSQAHVVQFTSMEETDRQKDRVPTEGANPRPGWTCRQGGFSWMALGLEPLGWAQEQRAPASLPSAPGWLGSLCPHFHAHHFLPLCVPGSKPSLPPLDLVPADLAQDGGFSSGVPKMLEAILFFLTGCSVGSSKPNEKLDPPPGGRKTRELFLLLGSTPLKVVVVVMAQRGEVGWP